MEAQIEASIEPTRYRQVLGQYPTGVTVITAKKPDGSPVGMAIGSFTSVSLDPPLVAFLPDKTSTSWPHIRDAGSFCVNVLSADQESVCRAFASSGSDKFAGISHHPAPSGAPVIEGAVAWIDCELSAVHDAGDHHIALGKVHALDVANPSLPLLFFRGGYGRFSPLSLASSEPELLPHMRVVDLARAEMESIAEELETECIAVAPHGAQLVFVASAGERRRDTAPTRVGQRAPFAPPFGTAIIAWDEVEARRWLDRGELVTPNGQIFQEQLEKIRARGYTFSLGFDEYERLETALEGTSSDDPSEMRVQMLSHWLAGQQSTDEFVEARNISAPIFGPEGTPVLQLTVYGPQEKVRESTVLHIGRRLVEATTRITLATGGRLPEGRQYLTFDQKTTKI